MRTRRVARTALCAALAVGMAGGLQAPAQAAPIASGSAVGGSGASSCGLTASCAAFEDQCAITAANDIDASVRRATPGSLVRTVRWSATIPVPSFNRIKVVSFNANCQPVGAAAQIGPAGGQMVFPPGTAWIAVLVLDPFAQLTWSVT